VSRGYTRLKESFPGIKFSVKSSTYSMGASIRIRWLDGPNTKRGVLSKHSDRLAVKDSPTLARVRFTGDDGYGQGTVGRHGSGGDLCAKAVAQNRERMRA